MAVFVDHLGQEFDSQAQCAIAWGLTPATLKGRLRDGMSVKRALTKKYVPKRHPCRDHLGNEYPTIAAMARAYYISVGTLRTRLRMGWPLKDALTRDLSPPRVSPATMPRDISSRASPAWPDPTD